MFKHVELCDALKRSTSFRCREKIIDIDNDVYWTYFCLIKGSYLWTLSFDKKNSFEKLMSMQNKKNFAKPLDSITQIRRIQNQKISSKIIRFLVSIIRIRWIILNMIEIYFVRTFQIIANILCKLVGPEHSKNEFLPISF